MKFHDLKTSMIDFKADGDRLQYRIRQAKLSYYATKHGALPHICKAIVGNAALVMLFWMIALAILTHPPGGEQVAKQLKDNFTYHTNAAVLSRDGELIGSLRTNAKGQSDAEHSDRRGSLITDDPPEIFKTLLMAREDMHLHFEDVSFWDAVFFQERHYRGIDLWAIANVMTGRGGSTLCMQTAKNTRGLHFYRRHTGDEDALPGLFRRKYDEYAGCSTLWPQLRANNGRLFWQMVATTSPIISIGRTLRSLRDASLMLFNKEPQQLSPGQQALLSAATFRQIEYEFAEDNGIAQARWDLIRKKARRTAKQVYGTETAKTYNPALYMEIINELDGALAKAPTHVAFPYRIRGFIDAQKKQGKPPTLEERLKYTLNSSYDQLLPQLYRWKMDIPRAHTQQLQLSIDWGANYGFKRKLDKTFKRLNKRVHRLNHKLYDDELDLRPQATIHVRVLDRQGHQLRVFKRGTHQDIGEPIASLGKLFALLPVISHGAKPKDLFCNRRAVGKNASGLMRRGVKSCQRVRSGSHYSLEETIGRSFNLPMLEAARKTTKAKFDTPQQQSTYWLNLYKQFGLEIDDPLPLEQIPNIERMSAMVFGRVLASPAHMLTLSAQLFTVLDEQKTCISNTIITGMRVTHEGQVIDLPKPPTPCDVRDAFVQHIGQHSQNFRHLLRAPVTHPKGTLAFAQDLEKKHKLTIKYAKTGTSQTINQNTRAKWVVMRIADTDHDTHYDVMILIAAKHDQLHLGLGKNVSTRALMEPVLDTVMQDLKRFPAK